MLQKILQLRVLPMLARRTISCLNCRQIDDGGQKIFDLLIDKRHWLFAERSIFERKLRKVERHSIPFNGETYFQSRYILKSCGEKSTIDVMKRDNRTIDIASRR